MFLSRRGLFVSTLLTNMRDDRATVRPVNRLVEGSPCHSPQSKEAWAERVKTFESAESVVCLAKQFYAELVEHEAVTEEAAMCFRRLNSMEEASPLAKRIVDEMRDTAVDAQLFDECFFI
jgi:hypothetical protein